MINISRNQNSPLALEIPEIKDYIINYINYSNDPDNYSKPKKPVSYRSSDLLEAFDRDFHSKCYLTEQKFANSWFMDIEHFIPQNEQGELIYEWSNLFPAEHYTNMIKPRSTPLGGYFDPCCENDDVENDIVYNLSVHGNDPSFTPRYANIPKAQNTCNLLNRLHNGHDYNTEKATESLRHAIHKKYIEILHKVIEYKSNPDGSQEKFQALKELKDLVSRKSSFTMLCRSIPALKFVTEDIFD